MFLFQGFRFAIGQDSGLNRRHAELVIRELAKFHAISYCMKKGSNDSLLNAYTYLAEDSLYRSGYQICPTFDSFGKKAIMYILYFFPLFDFFLKKSKSL